MYQIFTFENGQPAILFLEKSIVYLYVINRGKIVKKGPLFNDVASGLHILGNTPYYIYYISTDNTIKIHITTGQHLSEIVNFPLNKLCSSPYDFSSISAVLINNIFHIILSHKNNYTLLYLDEHNNFVKVPDTNCSNFSQTVSSENKITSLNSESTDRTREITLLNKEIKKLKSNQQYISAQYDELAEYTGKLQEELRKSRYGI